MARILILFALILVGFQARAAAPESFSYGAHPDQTFDLYRPARARNAPILVMLHGGGWRRGDKTHDRVWENKVAHWGGQGFLFVSVNTRLLPDADPLEQTRDLARAVAAIQKQARGWGGDPKRIVLMGHSAGAHVASLLATREDIRREAGVARWRGTILLDTGATDVEKLMSGWVPRLYHDAFGTDPAFWKATSPIRQVGPREGPFLVVCSAKRIEPCPSARAFAETAAGSGVSVRVLPVPLRHGEINEDLGKPSSYTAAVDAWIARVLR